MKKLYLFFILLLLSFKFVIAQDCGDCGQRSIFIYNFEMGMKPYTADHDSIINFFNGLKAAPTIADYLQQSDPTKDCIIVNEDAPVARYLDSTRALNEPYLLDEIASWLDHSPKGEMPDYYIIGTVNPYSDQGNNALFVHFFLLAGPSQEEVTYGYALLELYPAGNIEQTINKAMTEKFGSAMDKIRDFEVKKRDQGEPYAINPTLTLTADKLALDFNEQTVVHVSLSDCDDTPLKDRTITLSAEGGEIDQTSVTTDDEGTADLVFTAGTNPEIAVIQPEFSYKKPCDKEGEIDLSPLAIQIKKPEGCWFVQINSTMDERSKNTSYTEVGGTQSQNDEFQTHRSTFIAAWINATLYENPYTKMVTVVSQPGFVNVKYRIRQDEGGSGNTQWFFSTENYEAYSKVNTQRNIFSQSINTGFPEQLVSVDDDDFSFDFTKFDATQNGSTHEQGASYDPINGFNEYESNTPADPDKTFNYNVTGVSFDTTYYSNDVTENDGLRERKYYSVNQTCSWTINTTKIFKLDRKSQSVTDDDYNNFGLSEKHYLQLDQHSKILMYYNPPTTGIEDEIQNEIPGSFSLEQNYPNPFNPSTVIKYSIPGISNVKLTVFNLLGEEIITLINKEIIAGNYEVEFNAENIPSGIYFYQLKAGDFIQTKKMIFMK